MHPCSHDVPPIVVGRIECPWCGHSQCEFMPTDCRVAALTCEGCAKAIVARSPGCCVFCDYGTVPCPLAQQSDDFDLPPFVVPQRAPAVAWTAKASTEP